MKIFVKGNEPLTTASIVTVSISMGDLLSMLGKRSEFQVHTPGGPAHVQRINANGQDQFAVISQSGKSQAPFPSDWADDIASTLLPIEGPLPNTITGMMDLKDRLANELRRAANNTNTTLAPIEVD